MSSIPPLEPECASPQEAHGPGGEGLKEILSHNDCNNDFLKTAFIAINRSLSRALCQNGTSSGTRALNLCPHMQHEVLDQSARMPHTCPSGHGEPCPLARRGQHCRVSSLGYHIVSRVFSDVAPTRGNLRRWHPLETLAAIYADPEQVLDRAVRQGCYSIAEAALRWGRANPSSCGHRSMISCLEKCDGKALALFLQYQPEADIDPGYFGRRALLAAIKDENARFVRVFLTALRSTEPFRKCIMSGRQPSLLIPMSTDPCLSFPLMPLGCSSTHPTMGGVALHAATCSGNAEMVSILLSAPPVLSAINGSDFASALNWACSNGLHDVACTLISAIKQHYMVSGDPNVTSNSNRRVLDENYRAMLKEAIKSTLSGCSGRQETLGILLKELKSHVHDFNISSLPENVLALAIHSNRPIMVEQLLLAGIPPNINALTAAVESGSVTVAKTLLAHPSFNRYEEGASSTSVADTGSALVRTALRNKDTPMLSLLIVEHGFVGQWAEVRSLASHLRAITASFISDQQQHQIGTLAADPVPAEGAQSALQCLKFMVSKRVALDVQAITESAAFQRCMGIVEQSSQSLIGGWLRAVALVSGLPMPFSADAVTSMLSHLDSGFSYTQNLRESSLAKLAILMACWLAVDTEIKDALLMQSPAIVALRVAVRVLGPVEVFVASNASGLPPEKVWLDHALQLVLPVIEGKNSLFSPEPSSVITSFSVRKLAEFYHLLAIRLSQAGEVVELSAWAQEISLALSRYSSPAQGIHAAVGNANFVAPPTGMNRVIGQRSPGLLLTSNPKKIAKYS